MSNQSFKHVFPIFSFTSSSKDFTFSVQLEENKNAAQNSLYYVNVMEVPFLPDIYVYSILDILTMLSSGS